VPAVGGTRALPWDARDNGASGTPAAPSAAAVTPTATTCCPGATHLRCPRPALPVLHRHRPAGVFPGGRQIPFVTRLETHPPESQAPIPVFRVMDEDGSVRPGAAAPSADRDTCLRMYSTMVRLQVMDTVFYEAQRQGRISFYMTNWGEEGIHIGTAMALRDDDDVFAQYREAGVLMWRGFTLQNFADQLFANVDDLGKGRQMPVHYGSARLHFHTISSPLTTQLPQAAGAAYACKLEGKGRVVACYFGDGAASEGDAHAAMNMAATLGAPVIFVCRNNGYAISTPVKEQYAGDGIAARGLAYGMHTIRVDGNDVWAVHAATAAARDIASGADGSGVCKPVLLEAMSYREGHHSTSDDSTRYRTVEEIKSWREQSNPVRRLRAFLEAKGWWDGDKEEALFGSERRAVLAAMAAAERKPMPELKVRGRDDEAAGGCCTWGLLPAANAW
jgi:2-oxoisovalerate dehydrogenase E1 component alpha subunit